MKHVVIVADVPGWAWDRKAQHLRRWLSGEFEVEVAYHQRGNIPTKADLYHTFEFPQVDRMPVGSKVITGLTAHVWKTWGAEAVKRWAGRAVAVHANSILLQKELEPLIGKVYYTPNGVCPEQFQRTRPREGEKLVAGHVGKPNPRKGAHIIEAACAKVGVELRKVQHRVQTALTAEQMLDWYQDIDVMLVASDMDGTPNPALEGGACEVMTISNRIGNMPEFIEEGVSGFLVPRSAEGIAERLFGLQVEQAREMGLRARERVLKEWSWEKQSEWVRAMWRTVLS